MLAVELQRYGGPEGLVPVELPDPEPGPGEARVDLVAAALNRRDWWIRTGGKAALPVVLGSDGAGVVSAVGSGVEDVEVGDEVVINPALDWGDAEDAAGPDFRILGVPDQGTYAERIVVKASQLRLRPRGYTWIEAAALPLGGLTAWRAVVTHGEPWPGRTLLVPGAGGGVATFVIQIAAALGARVLVTSSSAEKLERARRLGAEGGADYGGPDWPELLGPVDAVVDSVGGASWPGALRALRPGGGWSPSGTQQGRWQRSTWPESSSRGSGSRARRWAVRASSTHSSGTLPRRAGAPWWTVSSRSGTRRQRTSVWTRRTASARSCSRSTKADSNQTEEDGGVSASSAPDWTERISGEMGERERLYFSS